MTGHRKETPQPSVVVVYQRRRFVAATLLYVLAAWIEKAAARAVPGTGHNAGNRRQALVFPITFRHGVKQGRRIGMARPGKKLVNSPLLRLPARIHDRNALRGFRHDRHVVGDQHQCHAFLALQADQKIEDLCLNGHVERRRRLVRDQELRIAGNGHGNHGALIHAAAELMREGIEARFRRRNANQAEKFDRPFTALLPGSADVGLECLVDLEPDGEAGIEAAHGFLENHRHVLAGHAPPGTGRDVPQVYPVEAHAVGGDLRGPGQKPHQRQHRDAFAGSRFTDDTQNAAFFDVHVDPVNSPKQALGGLKLYREVADFQKRHGH